MHRSPHDPARSIRQQADGDSPSPGGEGRGEGVRLYLQTASNRPLAGQGQPKLEAQFLIADKLLKIFPRLRLPRIAFSLGRPVAADEIKVLAEISQMFIRHRVRTAVAALMSGARIVAHAIQADFQIGPALMTTFGAARQAGQPVFPAAIVAMPGHFVSDGSRFSKMCR